MKELKVSKHFTNTLVGAVIHAFWDEKSTQEVIHSKPETLRQVITILKNELFFTMLIDIVAVDWLKVRERRFELNYLFYNVKENTRVQIKVALTDNDKPSIDSITDLYPAANWAEREVFDLVGIFFNNHPNLKRLLMWKEFVGHPLRKDYPLNFRQPIPTLEELL